MKLSKIVAEKYNGSVPSIDYRATLREASKMMREKQCAALMVTDLEHFDPLQYKGLFTALQFVGALAGGADPDRDKVGDYMLMRLIVATGEDDVEYLKNVMVRHKLTHLPVIQNKKVAAIISMADILEVENIEKDIKLHWLSDFTGAPGGDRNQVF
ncbi:MAG: CBS domain protein [Lentisphaerae bacterium ADurb.Bin242]|nr:MAG: CBS domain protein [Lentisphaerae bacterium ADurb.Bin242]